MKPRERRCREDHCPTVERGLLEDWDCILKHLVHHLKSLNRFAGISESPEVVCKLLLACASF